MIKNKKGYTLTELLIVLGISGIIISMIVSFFVNNTNYYNKIDNDTELQYQAQFIMNFMADDLMGTSEIKHVTKYVNNVEKDKVNQSSVDELRKLEVNKLYTNNGETTTETSIYFVENGYLKFTNDKTVTSDKADNIGGHIETLKLTAVPISLSFKNAKGLKLEINFKKDKQSYSTEQIIYFRNSNY